MIRGRSSKAPRQGGTGVPPSARIAASDTYEILTNEKQETAAGFCSRANAHYESLGVTVKRVLSGNGPGYRSKLSNDALSDAAHKYTRPCRPQTNGKIERFHRTLAWEWASAHHYNSDAARPATQDSWIHSDKHHRLHTGIRGKSPIDRVHIVTGKNT